MRHPVTNRPYTAEAKEYERSHVTSLKSDLFLTWFRAYDAALRQWLSRDPIAENGGINLYGYALNNPITLWDPLGLISCKRLQEMWDNALQAYQDATADANWADSAITQTQNFQIAQNYAKYTSKVGAVGALAVATAGTSVAAVGPTTGVLTGTESSWWHPILSSIGSPICSHNSCGWHCFDCCRKYSSNIRCPLSKRSERY